LRGVDIAPCAHRWGQPAGRGIEGVPGRAVEGDRGIGCVPAHEVDDAFEQVEQLVARVRLTAADADMSIGDGPEVAGSALSLLLLVSGRRVALDSLDGPGVDALTS
jgi:hypothetical protein